MFALLKRKKPYEQEALSLFGRVYAQSRSPVFFEKLEIPDTTEGRFDVLTMHMFMVMHRLKHSGAGQALSQALFDVAFSDIDRGFREIGVGDMGIPKRMKKMMLGFNGSIHAYEQALLDGKNIKEALRRNIYTLYIGDDEDLATVLDDLSGYMHGNIDYLQSQDDASIMAGVLTFKNFDKV